MGEVSRGHLPEQQERSGELSIGTDPGLCVGGLCLRPRVNLRLEPVTIPGSEHAVSLRMHPVSAAFPAVTEIRTWNRVNTTWGRKFGRRAGPIGFQAGEAGQCPWRTHLTGS